MIAQGSWAAVVWGDAHADYAGGWVHPTHRDTRPYLVTSVGHVVTPKPNHISLCLNIAEDGNEDSHIHIPLGMVKSITKLTVNKEKQNEPKGRTTKVDGSSKIVRGNNDRHTGT